MRTLRPDPFTSVSNRFIAMQEKHETKPSYDIADLRDYDLPSEGQWLTHRLFSFNGVNVRHCVMQDAQARWHSHADSDEYFQVLAGELLVDVRLSENGDVRNIVVKPGQMIAIHAGAEHRAYSHGRAVVLVMDTLKK